MKISEVKDMLWYEMTGKQNDIVVSSRVRLARNLADYPFGGRLDEPSALEILEKVRGVFDGTSDYSFTQFNTLSDTSRRAEADRAKRGIVASWGSPFLVSVLHSQNHKSGT